ncbi:hypothetical protein [Streptomyces niveus]|uniref:hypothetical protein n=1 Tax=Streptomyces niveus TaxID=193462 RepID=UPI0036D29A86
MRADEAFVVDWGPGAGRTLNGPLYEGLQLAWPLLGIGDHVTDPVVHCGMFGE